MPRRSAVAIWTGRAIFGAIIAALIIYMIASGLDKADKLASTISVLAALLALAAPYLLPPPTAASGVPPAVEPAAPLAVRRTAAPTAPPSAHAPGVGAVAVGGDSNAAISTEVSGHAPEPAPPPQPATPGVTATGTGAVAIGGTSNAPITTRVTGPHKPSP
ncbi:hypothetical protein AB0C07_30250 [Actinoplanes missouriensis]|uniref:hypothetical protein n=1 Tax=Actinoplanes missouriensis TaxID=1866 RepID=UPI00340ADB30